MHVRVCVYTLYLKVQNTSQDIVRYLLLIARRVAGYSPLLLLQCMFSHPAASRRQWFHPPIGLASSPLTDPQLLTPTRALWLWKLLQGCPVLLIHCRRPFPALWCPALLSMPLSRLPAPMTGLGPLCLHHSSPTPVVLSHGVVSIYLFPLIFWPVVCWERLN